MATDKETLLSMGFEPARVDWALRATSNAGLQPALDFLIAHADDPIPDSTAQSGSSAAASGQTSVPTDENEDEDAEALQAALGKASANIAGSASGGDANVEAKSIKCSECGKIFKNTALANFHAEKSGHDQFEESTEELKPLTEEEKQQKLADLRAKLAEKRAQKSVVEAEEVRSNTAIRRKADREAMEARELLKEKEALKAIELARREKEEEKAARKAIKEKIEQDKEERRLRREREKALKEGTALPAPATPVQSTPVAATPGIPASEYKETRLQIRLGSGEKYTTALPSESTLREVAEFVASQTLSVDVETVTFAMHYPRKQFTRDDFSKSLRELGLTPSAVLIAS